MDVRDGVPLAPLCTLETGGPAAHLALAHSADEVEAALDWARRRALPTLVLGGGSNLLVSDDGYPGLVIRPLLTDLRFEGEDGACRVTAGAGVGWDVLVATAVARGLSGVEALSGIPGLVGATPIQNVGAYGQEVADTVVSVTVLDRASGARREIPRDACGFGYRTSRFKQAGGDAFVVLGVTFRLPRDHPVVQYADIDRELAEQGVTRPTLADVRAAVLAVRRAKSMVPDPQDENRRSAGSFFLNPVLDASALAAVEGRLREAGAPAWPAPGGRTKLSAAWLIERAGFNRGYARGRAGISTRHTLALVNRGGATAAEIVALAREVRDGVRERFGISLVPEPVLVGLSLD